MSEGYARSLDTVTPERVDWLWPGRLPRGKLSVLDGDPSLGKSTLSLDFAARVTTGTPWPDGEPCPLGSVLLLSAEDGLADTVRPRLNAAGADPTRVHALQEVPAADGKTRPPSLADLDLIEAEIKRVNASFVVVDVLMAFMPTGVDSHRDQDVRGILHRLAAVAERQHCAVLVLRHLNKAGGGNALYRGGGSIGIVGAARSALLVATDPDDDSLRVLALIKSNLAIAPAALTYRLVDAPEHGCARIQWAGESSRSANELLHAPDDPDERAERSVAAEWLEAHLRDRGGTVDSAEVKEAAKREGIAVRTLQRARDRLGVVPQAVGRRSVWRLPTRATSGGTGRGGTGGTGQESPSDQGVYAAGGNENGTCASSPVLAQVADSMPQRQVSDSAQVLDFPSGNASQNDAGRESASHGYGQSQGDADPSREGGMPEGEPVGSSRLRCRACGAGVPAGRVRCTDCWARAVRQ